MPNATINTDPTTQSNMSIKELQSWWEVPSVAYFCSLFREAFNMLEFSIEELEEALVNVGNDTFTGSSPLVLQLLITLLQGCLNRKDINLSNYDPFLKEFLTNKYYEDNRKPNVWGSAPAFLDMPLRTKVIVLHELCNYRLEAVDVADIIKNWESDSLRVEPLGTDQTGALYWYFYGTRLYQEILPKKSSEKKNSSHNKVRKRRVKRRQREERKSKKESKNRIDEIERNANSSKGAEWKVVCSTEEEWKQFAEKFAKSSNRCEKTLYKRIVDDFLPEIGRLIMEKEKTFKKRLLEMAPKRVSHRIERFKQQEQEKAAQRLQEEEQFHEEVKARRMEEESKRKRKEIKERERRALERMQMKEDRARRANRRREHGDRPTDLKPEPIYRYTTKVGRTLHKPSMTHGTRGSTSYFETNEAQRMYKVLQTIQKHKDAWPFRDPITERFAPGYFSFIANPMDLSTIGKKLHNGEYENPREFEKDFVLMFENCRKYNGPVSEYTQMANSVNAVLENVMKEVFPLHSESLDQRPDEFRRAVKSQTRIKTETIGVSTNGNVAASRTQTVSVMTTATTTTTTNATTNSSASANFQLKEIKPGVSTCVAGVNRNTTVTVIAGTSKVSSSAAPNQSARKESLLRKTLSQDIQTRLPITVISANSAKLMKEKPDSSKLALLTTRNGLHPPIQSLKSNVNSSATKYTVVSSKGNLGTASKLKASTLSKMTVFQIGKDKKIVIAGDGIIGGSSGGQLGNLTTVQTNSNLNGIPIKRVYKVINNGWSTKGEKRAHDTTVLNEPQQKRLADETVLNVGPSTVDPPQQPPQPPQVTHPTTTTIIDPAHAGYCIQVPAVTNCTQQPIITVASEGQQYEISNGASLESILQPTYIQTQVQTQPMQYNYIDIAQLQQPQQQQLVIPVNSQFVYTSPDVMTTVGSMLQVYPSMVFQVASPVHQQQQIFPVQYYEAVSNGVLS